MDFTKPGPNKRVCAFFIDIIAGQILGVLFSFIAARNMGWIVQTVYLLLKDGIDGQSIGRRLVGTQVTDESGMPAAFSKTVVRNIFMVIPIFPIIEYVRMLRDKEEGKRIGDNVAKTKVNDLKPQLQDGTFLWISIALAIILTVIQISLFGMFVKQHPELIK